MSSPEAQQPAPEPVKRWEDIEAIANENPGALKWILVSKLRLTVPEQLKGEEGERAMNIAAVRMDQSEAIVVGSTTADTPWPTQGDTGLLHEHAEQQVLAELHVRSDESVGSCDAVLPKPLDPDAMRVLMQGCGV